MALSRSAVSCPRGAVVACASAVVACGSAGVWIGASLTAGIFNPAASFESRWGRHRLPNHSADLAPNLRPGWHFRCPSTGGLTSSDEGRAGRERRADAPALTSISTARTCAFHLENAKGKALKRVEGVSVDDSGGGWVLLENDCELRRVKAGAS